MMFFRLLLTSCLLIVPASARAAFVTIDNFGNPSPGVFYQITPPGGGPNSAVFNHATGFGSTRTATLTVDQPSPATPNALTGTLGFESAFGRGVLDFNSGAFTQAHAILNYSSFTGGSENFGALGVPMYIYLNFLNLDPGIDLSTASPALNMPMDIAISTAGGTLTGSFLLSSTPSPVSYQIPIASLAGTADLSQVISMTLTFNGGPNQRQRADFVITDVILEAVPVPVPPTAFLALLGLPVLHRLRRR